ncbi:peptidoglycan/LPS O-acetylase OafA/YrhL [Nitrobacteraceae bacterium AZCC 1564]
MHAPVTSISARTQYRPDIDGLRAIAVLSVIAFHYGAPLPGGFTGVDVFFVISSFLITQQLYSGIQNGTFSILSFYDRRLKRILPALLVMLAAVLIVSRWLLMPGDYVSLAASSIAAAFGASNFYFLFNTGYFDQSAELLPQLHTWSLGVEEQFYLFWPLLLFAIAKACRRIDLVIGGVVIAGFVASLFWMDANPKEAFYLVAPRAWELAIGALLVFLPPLSRSFGEAATAVGLALIGFGFFVVRSEAFPGLAALYPCIGAALVIWPRASLTTTGEWLGVASPIGLISYSLYLWHWPAWVLFRIYANNEQPNSREAVAIFCITLAASIASFFLVERPLRLYPWRVTYPIKLGFISCLTLAAAGFFVKAADGFPSRISKDAYNMRSLNVMWDWKCPSSRQGNCVFGSPWDTATQHVLLWGDSHAEHLTAMLEPLALRANAAIMLVNGCPSILDGQTVKRFIPESPRYNESCRASNEATLRTLASSGIDTIVLASAWGWIAKNVDGASGKIDFDQGKSAVTAGMRTLLDRLSPLDRKIFVLTDNPPWPASPVACALTNSGLLRRACPDDLTFITQEQFRANEGWETSAFTSAADGHQNASIVPLGDNLCRSEKCTTAIDGEFLYRDNGHFRRNLSPDTTAKLADLLGLAAIFTNRSEASHTERPRGLGVTKSRTTLP